VELLIDRSGYFLTISDDEPIDDLVVSVAVGETDFEALIIWFQERLKKRKSEAGP
jgi:death-on-curing protein